MMGLVTSFLSALTPLVEMDRQKQQDKAQAAQRAVQNAMEEHRIELEKAQAEETKVFHQRELGLREQSESRLEAQMQQRAAAADEMMKFRLKNLDATNQRKTGDWYTKRVKELEDQGLGPVYAREQALSEVGPMAESLGAKAPAAAPSTGLGMNVGVGQPASTSVGVLGSALQQGLYPKQQQTAQKAADAHGVAMATIDLKDAQTKEIAARTLEITTYDQHIKNMDARATQRENIMLPLQQMEKQLGIQRTRQEIENNALVAPINRAIKELELKRLRDPIGAGKSAAAMRETLKGIKTTYEQDYKSSEQQYNDAVKANARTMSVIDKGLALRKNGSITPEQEASLQAALQEHRDRNKRVMQFRAEMDKAKAGRQEVQQSLNKLTGIDELGLNRDGTLKANPPVKATVNALKASERRNAPARVQAVKPPKGAKIIKFEDFLRGKR